MADSPTKLPLRPAKAKAALTPTRDEFRARLKALADAGQIPDGTLDPEVFDDWEDAADLAKHFKVAAVEPLGHRDIAGIRRRAGFGRQNITRPNRPMTHEISGKPSTRKHDTELVGKQISAVRRVNEEAKDSPKARKVSGRPSTRKHDTGLVGKHISAVRRVNGEAKDSPKARKVSGKPRTRKHDTGLVGKHISAVRKKAPMAQLVRPGVSLGPPKRFIGLRIITPEIDISEAKFRRQRTGIGKCTGGNLKDVRRAFGSAYVLLDTAKEEVRAMKRNPTDARVLWHASMENEVSALSYWFGEDYSQQETMRMLQKIDDILTEWSMAFCGGFRDLLPVFIRCKSKNGVGGGPARHLVKNTIELFPRYFDMPPAKQLITMLHEMGHRGTSMLKPRDERHDLCSGGWNRAENMCYRDNSEVIENKDLFCGGNPRILAKAASSGNSSAKKTLLNNIDNYVCYIWNRYADHGERKMFLLTEGAKQGFPKSPGRSKPIR